MTSERIVLLPAEPHDSLDWQLPEDAERVLWKFRLGLEQPSFPTEDELRFQASALALKQFSTHVWPLYQNNTAGCILYQGPLAHLPDPMYFQMLAHKLPDELPIFLLLDERDVSSVAQVLCLLADERWGHFSVGLRSERVPRDGFVWDESGVRVRKLAVGRGLVFPEVCDEGVLRRVDTLLAEGKDLKVVFESHLTEEWDGLDQLIVLEDRISERGVRKLKGFEAAGGEVVYLEKFRGRGI